MRTTGVSASRRRNAFTIASVFFKVMPDFKARRLEAWIAGPSAIGSENGMPSSITSAPASASPPRIFAEVAPSGSPAVRNVTSPPRPASFSAAKRLVRRLAPLPLTASIPARRRR